MPVETFGYIDSLNVNYPVPADGLVNGDDHIRGIKATLKATFPYMTASTYIGPVKLNDLQNGRVRLADDSAETPSLAFTDEATLGFYRPRTGVIGFTGTLRGLGARNPGDIFFHAGDTAPDGSYACDGQEVSRTTDAALFAVIGVRYGIGNGSTTFNLPNAKNRFPRHRDLSGNAGIVGTSLSWLLGGHVHTGSGSTSSVGAHQHYTTVTGYTSVAGAHIHAAGAAVLAGGGFGGAGLVAYTANGDPSGFTSSAGAHDHSLTAGGYSDAQGAHGHTYSFTTSSVGGAENRPDSITFLMCIQR